MLSITCYELNTPFVPRLLYVSLSLSSPSFSFSALVDSGASVNLIHTLLATRLGLSVTPCDGPQATLADGTTLLLCSSYVSLSYTLAGRTLQDTFFVAPIGAQSAILGMPFLERENPVIN